MSTVLETLPSAGSASVKKHRLSVEEILQMAEAGFFRGKPRMELIEGELIEMAPIGPRHAAAVTRVGRLLTRTLPESVQVRVQSSVQLGGEALPEPDIALVRAREDDYQSAHPGADDILAIIEVADTSLDYDRLTKALLYAQAGIAVYWLLDLGGRRMLCHRLPAASGYQQVTELSAEAVLELDGVPGWSLAIKKILGN